jgi:hypothetical protein
MNLKAASCGADTSVDFFEDSSCQQYLGTDTRNTNECDQSYLPLGAKSMKAVCRVEALTPPPPPPPPPQATSSPQPTSSRQSTSSPQPTSSPQSTPSLTISSSLPRVAFGQNLVLNALVSPGFDSQYKFDWSASKSLQVSDALTSLQSPSLVVKGSFFVDATAAVQFTCRVTNILTRVVAEASMSIAVNSPPECGGAVLSVISRDCVGDIGRSGCPVTAMLAKLRIILNNASGLTAMCSDADAPVRYRLLSFTTSCSSTSKGQVLSSSAAPSFESISVASGVRSLGIEATDSLGATFRTCSSDIEVNAASAAALTGMFQSASSSLAGDSEARKRLVFNTACSLSSLYASPYENTVLLDSVKAQALSFLNASSSAEITDAGDATQAVSSLNALVTLPGAMSAAQTASAVSMFGRFATSSFALLASGAATVDFAVEVAPILVGGSLNVFEKTVSTSSSRRILAYKTGMDAAYSVIVSAAKVQAFALAASQDAVVTEQAPFLVEGVRRLRSVSALAAIIPPSSLFGVAVSVAPDADSSSVVDVGVVVVVQATSPFQDAGSAVLISPIVAVASFNAATGAPISSTRNIVEAKFPVSQSSHDARVVANAAGQRKGEECVRVACHFCMLCAAADAVHSGVWFTMERVGCALVQLLLTRPSATLSHAFATSQLRHLPLLQRSSLWIAAELSEVRLC